MATSTIFDKPITGYKLVSTQYGDTLQKIALRELGDASQWPSLIAYNNLVYPWITDDPSLVGNGVIQTGNQILVPATVPEISNQTDPADLYFVDVGLNPDATIAIANGDLGTVSGASNLTQAWTNRLETDKGELIFHGEYGGLLRQLIGAANGPNAGLLAESYASADILADPRAKSIVSAEANISGSKITLTMSVQPIVADDNPVEITTVI